MFLGIRVVNVALALPLDQEFSYKLSDDDSNIGVGSIVRVMFRSREQIGIVTEVKMIQEADLNYKLNEVLGHYELPQLHNKTLDFARWVAKYNMVCFGNIIKMLLLNKKNVEYLLSEKDCVHFDNNTKVTDEVTLSDLQLGVVEQIYKKDLDTFSIHLIQGATGSGKTEVYLEAAQKIIDNNGQVLILLPEVLLATQLIERFKTRLKNCNIAKWNSSLSPKKRAIIWHGVLAGKVNIVVGARSALFLPFSNLKLAVIDEEHDNSFKQEEGIIYNARDMAIVRAKIEEFPILLSTATPSVETYYNAMQKKYELHQLPTRYTGVSLPEVEIVDLNQVSKKHNEWISTPLRDEIINCLERKKLSMIFLNRRGYSPLTLCKHCGEKFSCPNCQFWLVEHRKKNQMLCHYCGFSQEKLVKCPKCECEEKLLAIGPGIERIEEELQALFPNAKIAVLTSDTIGDFKKASKIIKAIENKEYDIILGTQMLAKGLNFPDLHLVGVIDADVSFAGSDLRILERTFQLLYQVAGRAGREQEKGLVLIQTSFPENQLLTHIKQWDYEAFINLEIKNRRDSFMPPFSRLAIVRAGASCEHNLQSFMHTIVQQAELNDDIEILGPSPSPMYKLRNKFRYRVIIRSKRHGDIQNYIMHWLGRIDIPSSIQLKVDIDPYNFL
jgi:primosomal protein N' (replication factor Y)